MDRLTTSPSRKDGKTRFMSVGRSPSVESPLIISRSSPDSKSILPTKISHTGRRRLNQSELTIGKPLWSNRVTSPLSTNK
eukprot:1978110-Karenia_brevis.AAC.1